MHYDVEEVDFANLVDGICQNINLTEDHEDAGLEPSVELSISQKLDFLVSERGVLDSLGLLSKECNRAFSTAQRSLRALKAGSMR